MNNYLLSKILNQSLESKKINILNFFNTFTSSIKREYPDLKY